MLGALLPEGRDWGPGCRERRCGPMITREEGHRGTGQMSSFLQEKALF